MKVLAEPRMLWLFGGVLVLLVLASGIGWALDRTARGEKARAVIENLNARIRASASSSP